MPRKGSNLRIKVKDEGVKAGKRRVSAEIIGDSKLFESSDTFANSGTIEKLSERLKVVITSEVQSYFQSGSEVMDLVGKMMKEKRSTKTPDLDAKK